MASTVSAPAPLGRTGVAPLRAGQGISFWLRRLHSLSGIIPVGAFLFEHILISNATAIGGPAAYARQVRFLASLPLVPVLELFKTKDADLVIVLQAVADVTRYGSVALDQDGRVTQFVEKGVAAGPGLINAGVYLLGKQIVRGLPAGTAISLEEEVFPRLLDRRVYGLVCTGLFIDIGVPDDLRRAQGLLTPHPRQ